MSQASLDRESPIPRIQETTGQIKVIPVHRETDAPNILLQIEQALNQSAQTADEQLVAKTGIDNLQRTVSEWNRLIAWYLGLPTNKGKNLTLRDIVQNVSTISPCEVIYPYTSYPELRRIAIIETKKVAPEKVIHPNNAYKERLLKVLGVLKADQTLADLAKLQETSGGKPSYHPVSNYAEFLATNIPGVSARVWLAERSGIQLDLSLDAFAKMVTPPKAIIVR